jgi:hypothetical protein
VALRRPEAGRRFHTRVRVIAAVLALFAVIFMVVAIGGMVTGRPGDKAGWVIRFLALLCFAGAVALNAAAH